MNAIENPTSKIENNIKEKANAAAKKSSASNNTQLNVFSNDGSFLKRFKLLQELDEKKKSTEALKKRLEWEDAIRLRGRRRRRLIKEARAKEEENKKMKKQQRVTASYMMTDSTASEYLNEIKKYNEQSCTDNSDHIRPLVK